MQFYQKMLCMLIDQLQLMVNLIDLYCYNFVYNQLLKYLLNHMLMLCQFHLLLLNLLHLPLIYKKYIQIGLELIIHLYFLLPNNEYLYFPTLEIKCLKIFQQFYQKKLYMLICQLLLMVNLIDLCCCNFVYNQLLKYLLIHMLMLRQSHLLSLNLHHLLLIYRKYIQIALELIIHLYFLLPNNEYLYFPTLEIKCLKIFQQFLIDNL